MNYKHSHHGHQRDSQYWPLISLLLFLWCFSQCHWSAQKDKCFGKHTKHSLLHQWLEERLRQLDVLQNCLNQWLKQMLVGGWCCLLLKLNQHHTPPHTDSSTTLCVCVTPTLTAKSRVEHLLASHCLYKPLLKDKFVLLLHTKQWRYLCLHFEHILYCLEEQLKALAIGG